MSVAAAPGGVRHAVVSLATFEVTLSPRTPPYSSRHPRTGNNDKANGSKEYGGGGAQEAALHQGGPELQGGNGGYG